MSASQSTAPSAMRTTSRRAPGSKYGTVGDVVCVPLKRDLIAYVQILEMRTKQSGVVGLFPSFSANCGIEAIKSMEPTCDQFQIELTGIAWKHWKVVAQRTAFSPAPRVDVGTSPCFVAEVDFVTSLKNAGVLPPDFRLYRDIRASHPKLQPGHIEALSIIMTFLGEHKLLSTEGAAEIATSKVPPDFSMTSDLLTPKGGQFYDVVFKKDFVRGYFYLDTKRKIATEWEEFKLH